MCRPKKPGGTVQALWLLIMKISPSEFVVPIFGKKKKNDRWIFLGTGFFFGEPAYLATADHVLGNMYEKIGIHVIDKIIGDVVY